MTRSLLPLDLDDLRRLGRLAARDRADLFRRRPETGALYRARLFAVALCQGGALHFVDGKNGIKDLDVWSFYTQSPARAFPPRRVGKADFGDPKFGITPGSPGFVGRRVDLIGRSIPGADPSEPIATLQSYLRSARTESARLLALKAVVIIEPEHLLGAIAWCAQPRKV